MAGGFGGYFDSAFLNISPDEESADEAASNSPQEPKAKEHACRTCGKVFGLKSRLTQHARVHHDIRPFVCSECGKAFKWSSHLRTHKERFHSAKHERCSWCGRTAKCFKNLLDWHVKYPEKCVGTSSSSADVARKDERPEPKPSLARHRLPKSRRAPPSDVSKQNRKQTSRTAARRRIPGDLHQSDKPVGNNGHPTLSTRQLRKSPRLNLRGQMVTTDGSDCPSADVGGQHDSTQESLYMDPSDHDDSKGKHTDPYTTTAGSDDSVADNSGQQDSMQERLYMDLSDDDYSKIKRTDPSAVTEGSDSSVPGSSGQQHDMQESLYMDLSDDDDSKIRRTDPFAATEGSDSSVPDCSGQQHDIQESLYMDLSDDDDSKIRRTDPFAATEGSDSSVPDSSGQQHEMQESLYLGLSDDDDDEVNRRHSDPFTSTEGSENSAADSSGPQPVVQESLHLDQSDDDDSLDSHAIEMERRLTWSRRGSPPREEESTNATEPENCGGSHGTSFASSDSSEVVGTLEEMLASRDTTIGEDEVAYIVSPCVQKLSLLHETDYYSGLVAAENILVHRDGSLDVDPWGYAAQVFDDPEKATADVLALVQLIVRLLPDERSGLSTHCNDFIDLCLATPPVSAAELLVHPFLQNAERGREAFQFSVDLFEFP